MLTAVLPPLGTQRSGSAIPAQIPRPGLPASKPHPVASADIGVPAAEQPIGLGQIARSASRVDELVEPPDVAGSNGSFAPQRSHSHRHRVLRSRDRNSTRPPNHRPRTGAGSASKRAARRFPPACRYPQTSTFQARRYLSHLSHGASGNPCRTAPKRRTRRFQSPCWPCPPP